MPAYNPHVAIQTWGPVAVIVGGYLLGIYFQSRSIAHLDRRIDDLRDSMTKRFDGLQDLLRSEVKRIDERLDRLEHPPFERLERLEHPVARHS
jgi:hypothetical protein